MESEEERFLKKVLKAEKNLDILAIDTFNLAKSLSNFISEKEHIIPSNRLIILNRKLAAILEVQYPVQS